MYTLDRFNEFLTQARSSRNSNHPAAVERFFDFALQYVSALNERNRYYTQRIQAESATVNEIQNELDQSLQNINDLEKEMMALSSDANHKIALLRFQSIGNRVLKKALQERSVRMNAQLSEQNVDLARQNNQLQEEIVVLTEQNTQMALDFANSLAEQNGRLVEQLDTLRTTFRNQESASNAARDAQLSQLQARLERALHTEEQTAQQNNILLSQMSAMNQHSILNPLYWSKASWYSFAIGVAVGEQAIEQYSDFKPIRRLVCRGAKKLFGKSDSEKKSVPESLKPAMTAEYQTHVSVPAVPVVRVHN